MFKSKSPEELAAAEAERAAKEEARRQREFDASPPGIARKAHANGDVLLQIQLDLQTQKPWIVPMVGSATWGETTDPNVVLNAVAAENWVRSQR